MLHGDRLFNLTLPLSTRTANRLAAFDFVNQNGFEYTTRRNLCSSCGIANLAATEKCFRNTNQPIQGTCE